MSKRPDLPVLFLKDQRLRAVLLRIWMLWMSKYNQVQKILQSAIKDPEEKPRSTVVRSRWYHRSSIRPNQQSRKLWDKETKPNVSLTHWLLAGTVYMMLIKWNDTSVPVSPLPIKRVQSEGNTPVNKIHLLITHTCRLLIHCDHCENTTFTHFLFNCVK